MKIWLNGWLKMPVTTGNKKIKVLFYILVFIFLSTISFFERTNIFDNIIFFQLNKIEVQGNKKVDQKAIQSQLSGLFGKSLLFINPEDFEDILDENLEQENILETGTDVTGDNLLLEEEETEENKYKIKTDKDGKKTAFQWKTVADMEEEQFGTRNTDPEWVKEQAAKKREEKEKRGEG